MRQTNQKDLPKYLAELLRLASDADSALRSTIEDDIDSSEHFDDHPLAENARLTLKTLRMAEKVLIASLLDDNDQTLRKSLEKIQLMDNLAGRKSTLEKILNQTKIIK